jgi:hypothetical protein
MKEHLGIPIWVKRHNLILLSYEIGDEAIQNRGIIHISKLRILGEIPISGQEIYDSKAI